MLKSCVDAYGQPVTQTPEEILLDYLLLFVPLVGDLLIHMSSLPKNVWGVEFAMNGIVYRLFKSKMHEAWYKYFFG